MGGLALFAVCLLAVVANANGEVYQSSPELFSEWMGGKVPSYAGLSDSEAFGNLRRGILGRLKSWGESFLESIGYQVTAQEYPYYHFIPPYLASIIPDQGAVTWENKCHQTNTGKATTLSDGSIQIDITLSKATGLVCSDFYLFGTVSGMSFQDFGHANLTKTIVWQLKNATTAEKWDVQTNGIRVFKFLQGKAQSIESLLATVKLFVSEATKGVPEAVAKANLDFLKKYANVAMMPRNIQDVPVDESLIHSGDFFGIVRLDGLDPMLAWAMGSTTGHTTVALWIGGELYICESTTKDAYWPTNGIQKTPYKQWVKQAKDADYNVVWAPLSKEYRDKFDVDKAIQLFSGLEGVDYGYYNLLWGWIDTVKDNYPCVPPDFTQCLQFEHIPILFGNLYKLVPELGALLVEQALNHRVGTQNLPLADLMMVAAQKGMDFREVLTIPENDNWNYTTKRYNDTVVSKSMVCCVFVCNVWKAGGLFASINDELNCAEMTNWDDYALTIFDDVNSRPEACKTADPNNPVCQLGGKYTLDLNNYETKKMYPHMAENCPSRNPDYVKPDDC